MTHDKFQMLCEKVLVPRIGDLINRQVIDLGDTLEIIARELARIEEKLDKMAAEARFVDR